MKGEEEASRKRARRMVARIISGLPQAFLPMKGVDNPTSMVTVFQSELLSDRFMDHEEEVQGALIAAFDYYAAEAAEKAQGEMEQQLMMQGLHPSQLAAKAGGGATEE